jgi:hypothetical protein
VQHFGCGRGRGLTLLENNDCGCLPTERRHVVRLFSREIKTGTICGTGRDLPLCMLQSKVLDVHKLGRLAVGLARLARGSGNE